MFEAVWIDDLASKCLPERFLGEGAFGRVSQVMYAYNGGVSKLSFTKWIALTHFLRRDTL